MSQSPFHRCGIVVKRDAAAARETLSMVLECLQSLQIPAAVEQTTVASLGLDQPGLPLSELAREVELMIVVGGDGTLLRASREVLAAGIPVLGINLGRLGFMVDIAPATIATELPRILCGEYVEEPRTVLRMQDPRKQEGLAINDVVLRHPDPVSMLEFVTYADGDLISHHRADGLIVATPTGSTAYALSAGGPMLHPASDTVALVPISPHTLSDRPLILPGSSQIVVRISGRDGRGAIATLDGYQNLSLDNGDEVTIRQAPERLQLIHPADYDYYSILRSKLSWGRDKPQS